MLPLILGLSVNYKQSLNNQVTKKDLTAIINIINVPYMFINLSSETFVNKKKVSMCKAVFPPLNLREGVRKNSLF